ncbi:MAG TPA: hypothetical protein VIN62_00960 [Candidatus Cryosericum sp.]
MPVSFFCTGRRSERTGEEKWSLTVEKSRIASGPGIDGTWFYWYDNLIPMATANLLYVREGDSALPAVDPDTGTELWRKTLLTMEEIANEVKDLCDVIPVNDGILVVTDDAMDMYPIIELWSDRDTSTVLNTWSRVQLSA